jgi:hypothetical protein
LSERIDVFKSLITDYGRIEWSRTLRKFTTAPRDREITSFVPLILFGLGRILCALDLNLLLDGSWSPLAMRLLVGNLV